MSEIAGNLCTVIIPCFNYGEYVFSAIESVLNQTVKSIEVIVIDAGSTCEKTLKSLREFRNDRVKVFFREGRNYVGSNRNFGIELAKSEFVCCLDADDTLEPTYIEKCLYLLQAYNYDIISTSLKFVGERSGFGKIAQYPDLHLVSQMNNIHTCAVFRKSIWKKVGGFFDVGVGKQHIAEDWDFWIRCLALGARARNISKEALLYYRVHPTGSLSTASDNPSLEQQRQYILHRNKEILGPEAYEYSKLINMKKVSGSSGVSGLTRVMKPKSAHKTIVWVLPWLLVGGVERLVVEVIKSLNNFGWRTIVVTTEDQEKHSTSEEWIRECTSELFMLPKFLERKEQYAFIKYLFESRQPSHVVLGGSPSFYRMIPGMKQIFPEMVLIDFLFNIVGHTKSHRKYKSFFDFVFAENLEVINWFKEQGWTEDRIFQLFSGVDLEHFSPRSRSSRLVESLSLKDQDVVVGFSGRLSIEKGPDVFIEIAEMFSGCNNIKFVMTGSGPMIESIKKKINNMRNKENFHFLGLVDTVRDYVASFDILVLPSRKDGRPFIIMESMASGVAVVSSDVGGIREMVSEGENGFICSPGDVNEFAKRIRELVESKEKMLKFKLASRELAKKRFNSLEVFDRFNSVLSQTTSYVSQGGNH